jgi:tight adherence protein B
VKLPLHLHLIELFKYGGMALVGLSMMTIVWLAFADRSFIGRVLFRYTNFIDKSLRLLFLSGSGRVILRVQAVLVVLVCGVEALVGDVIPYWYGVIFAIAVMPLLYLSSERRKRIKKLEAQVDGFILTLSNALKTVPSPGAALQSIVPLIQDPTRQELEYVVKEMRVGNTLEQGLVNMSSRIGSKEVDAALCSVLVGLQVGGNLPAVLETTAGTIREMRRLETVVQARTGEGRAQLWVLAAFPFGICVLFNAVSPGYFDPLQQSVIGYIIVSVAVIFWVSSLLLARKVLTVDI